jgi:subtilisin family serine protease
VASQQYLDPAPMGVDARYAWGRADACGSSVGFVDLEAGWLFEHEDLPPITVLPGVCRDVDRDVVHHGTSVLGIVAGRHNNGHGIAGIARQPRRVAVASHFRRNLGTDTHVTDTIASLLPHMDAGDVLLLEWQDFHGRPPDIMPHIRDAVRAMSRLGVIVIECAGNGDGREPGGRFGYDLDTFPVLNRTSPVFEDSGAVLVGACHSMLDDSGTGHDRWTHPIGAGSNFGSRVDCHAWGEHVVTAGPRRQGGVTRKNSYKGDFGGTSAAGAIVAGVAVVVQGMHIAQKHRPLSPLEMREALSTQGTPQGAGVPGHIGVMPDLKRAAAALGL